MSPILASESSNEKVPDRKVVPSYRRDAYLKILKEKKAQGWIFRYKNQAKTKQREIARR